MGLNLVTAPTVLPVSVEEAKQHLRVTEDSEDTYIYGLIEAATQFAEEYTKRQFVTATWDLSMDEFPPAGRWIMDPSGWGYLDTEIVVPKPPLLTVTSITYVDLDGVNQTLSPAVYSVDTSIDPGRIRLAYNESWPSTRNQPNSVTIRFTCGYGGSSAVPAAIKAAIKLHVGHLYENREAIITGTIVTELSMAMRSLLDSVRIMRIQ